MILPGNLNNQRGAAQVLLLAAAIGLIGFLILTNFFSFKSKTFNPLYPKPISRAVSTTSGATFSLSAGSSMSIVQGEEVPVTIFTRSDTHKANLWSAKINFDKTKLQVVRIESSPTFVTQWVERTFDNNLGKVSVVGGVPKPGFSTSGSDAQMATVVFLARASGSVTVDFDPSSAVYRNSDNVNFLVSATGVTINITPLPTPSPTPTPTPTPTVTPSPSPTPTPSPTPSPAACAIASTGWIASQNPIDEGVLVTLTVVGNGDCLNKTVSFEIREDDGIFGFDPVNNNPVNATFYTPDTASTSWVAQYQPDGFYGIDDPPEYYFLATLVESGQVVHSQDPELQVNKSSSTSYKKGDANRDGQVDLQDLSIMFSNWFNTTDFPDEVDINKDGVVNVFDFSGMLVILVDNGVISSSSP